MNYVLPPKRWETAENPIYDPIRHKSWFNRLRRRKVHIPMMEAAVKFMENTASSQVATCEEFKIDSRELRDYLWFVQMKGRPVEYDRFVQIVIDQAYAMYCAEQAEYPYHTCIERVASKFDACSPRGMRELWETDPNLYPTAYQASMSNKK